MTGSSAAPLTRAASARTATPATRPGAPGFPRNAGVTRRPSSTGKRALSVEQAAAARGASSEWLASIRKLERWLDVLDQRDKDWFYRPSCMLMVGTQLCTAIEQWRMTHDESHRRWLRAWAEFEALNSLAAYAYENPNSAFPPGPRYASPNRKTSVPLWKGLVPQVSRPASM
jgi:hypothetical protein